MLQLLAQKKINPDAGLAGFSAYFENGFPVRLWNVSASVQEEASKQLLANQLGQRFVCEIIPLCPNIQQPMKWIRIIVLFTWLKAFKSAVYVTKKLDCFFLFCFFLIFAVMTLVFVFVDLESIHVNLCCMKKNMSVWIKCPMLFYYFEKCLTVKQLRNDCRL